MILVPIDTPGVEIRRPLTLFGYDDAPQGLMTYCIGSWLEPFSGHAEIKLSQVRVPLTNTLGKRGEGFLMAQVTWLNLQSEIVLVVIFERCRLAWALEESTTACALLA